MNRLVILAPNWLGDAVMALPAIGDVRRAAPAASITVAARASIAPLFAMAPDVDETLTFADGEAETLEAQRFDTALLLPNSTRAAIVARRAGIAERWGYRTGWRGSLLTRAIPAPRGVHQIEYYQHLVRALGFPSGPSEPRVTVPADARERAAGALAAAGWDGRAPLVALAPGAAYGGAKKWPAASFAGLVDALAVDGVSCAMVGSAADAATGAAVARACAGSRGPLNLIGRTDLSMLAGVMTLCRALVTNDSGAMHLGAAVGVSVTAVFGPTNEQATRPLGRAHTVLTHEVWCRPCMLRECPLDHACMRGVGAPAVLDAARRSL